MFLQMSVILSTGGRGVCLSACWDTTHPKSRHPPGADTSPHPPEQTPEGADTLHGADTPPGVRHPNSTPPLGTDTPLQSRPPPGIRLQHMVNEWLVCILLECIVIFEIYPYIINITLHLDHLSEQRHGIYSPRG